MRFLTNMGVFFLDIIKLKLCAPSSPPLGHSFFDAQFFLNIYYKKM